MPRSPIQEVVGVWQRSFAMPLLVFLSILPALQAQELLVEAESFTNSGGWVVDQQFVDTMGSSYLLAHGMGVPVGDAITTVQFPATGTYRLWVRNLDWTAPLTNHAGAFNLSVAGVNVSTVFGTVGQGWLWQDAGTVSITNLMTELRLKDQTGFEGRCDALYFTTNLTFIPTNSLPELTAWRRQLLALPAVPPSAGTFDLVVAGGGIAGCSAAIAAARQGLQVAFIQDRPWLGGNASQEIRVATQGADMGGIVSEINSTGNGNGSDSTSQYDLRRQQVVQNETNIHVFLEWRAFRVNTNGAVITSLDARQNRTGQELRFSAPLFVDSTGDGWIGYWAGAQYRMGREAGAEFGESLAPTNADRMTSGSSLMWNTSRATHAVSFPSVPWATNVSKECSLTGGDWTWEYGLNLDTIQDAEKIRDHLLQAIYGTFFTAKQSTANTNLQLSWVPYVVGKRESRRLVGDHILTQSDVQNRPFLPDGVVMGTWSIDLHYTITNGVTYDFRTDCVQTGVIPYWVPFRCLYSSNITNLMMAGRCLSATHVGLGSPRVMNTCGQMGVAVGVAAALCKQYNTTPRGVYQHYMAELQTLIGISPTYATLSNTVAIIDDTDPSRVAITGDWTTSTYNDGYYGVDYIHDGNANKGAKSIRFTPDLPLRGNYRVYARWTASGNRAANTPIDIIGNTGTNTVLVNQQINGGIWMLLGSNSFDLGNAGSVLIRTDGTTGYVIADAVAFTADFDLDPAFVGIPWADDDGDGVCNYAEYLNGTNPEDPASFLKVRLCKNDKSHLLFVSMAGKSYTIQYRNSISPRSLA